MTDAVISGMLTALPPTLAVLLAWWRERRKLKQIHMLVNGNHTAALIEIKHLQDLIDVIVQDAQADALEKRAVIRPALLEGGTDEPTV